MTNQPIQIISGDITQQNVDVIVNAANSSLLGGGGVDGAIHRAGGPDILAACQKIRQSKYPDGLPTGAAVITTGGKLPARFVIHTVGPIYTQDANPPVSLHNCYHNSLLLAKENLLTSIAFPSISTGVYGYPPQEAATIAWQTITSFLTNNPNSLTTVILTAFSPADARILKEAGEQL